MEPRAPWLLTVFTGVLQTSPQLPLYLPSTRRLVKVSVDQNHLVAQAHPRSSLGRKKCHFPMSYKPTKSDTPMPHPLSSLDPSQASPRMPSEPTSVHAQKAIHPCRLHQAIYPRSRGQKRKLVVNMRLLHNPLPSLSALILLGSALLTTSPHPLPHPLSIPTP